MAHKILVLGANSYLLSGLKANPNQIFIPYTKRVVSPDCHMDVIERADDLGVDTIIQGAWCSNSQSDYEFSRENYLWAEFTVNLAISSIQSNIRFVGIGTGKDDDTEFHTDYSKSKRETRNELATWINNNAMTWIRPFYIYSIYFKRPRILKGLLESSTKQEFKLQNPEILNDYLNLEDARNGISMVLDSPNNLYDLRSGFLVTNQYFINKMRGILNNFSDSAMPSELKQIDKSIGFDNLVQLGWQPEITISELNLTNSRIGH